MKKKMPVGIHGLVVTKQSFEKLLVLVILLLVTFEPLVFAQNRVLRPH